MRTRHLAAAVITITMTALAYLAGSLVWLAHTMRGTRR